MMTTYNFYDTSSLLLREKDLFTHEENIILSSITLNELENIKTSNNKDGEIKRAARHIIRLLEENTDKYEIWVYNSQMLQGEKNLGLPDFSQWELTNDIKILASAVSYDRMIHPDETVFFTNDLALKQIANMFFGSDSVKSVRTEPEEDYDGYRRIQMTEDEMAEFYSKPTENIYNLNINEYLIISDTNDDIIDTVCWTGEEYRRLDYGVFDSSYFGKIKPMKGDIYQALFADSLVRNKLTMVKGPAGTGKSFLSLAFLFHQLEHNRIDKIVIFCNTVATKNSAKLGYYPGSREEKLLDSQIGNFLSSKLGGRVAIEQLIQEEQLILLPFSDIRGYDTSGMRAGVYITEAQNLDVSLIKLGLQRIGEDSICIIDGDYQTQLDMDEFAGDNNGMRRVSKVFRNHDIYGEVTLKTIHRSKLASIAEAL